MFKSIKRTAFLMRHVVTYASSFGRDIADVHIGLLGAGWPANDIVDICVVAGYDGASFRLLMYRLDLFVHHGDVDSIAEIKIWLSDAGVRRADRDGVGAWVAQRLSDVPLCPSSSTAKRPPQTGTASHAVAHNDTSDALDQVEGAPQQRGEQVGEMDESMFGKDLVDMLRNITAWLVLQVSHDAGAGKVPSAMVAAGMDAVGEHFVSLARRLCTLELAIAHGTTSDDDALVQQSLLDEGEDFGADFVDLMRRLARESLSQDQLRNRR